KGWPHRAARYAIALPDKVDTDWNDVLKQALSNRTDLDVLERSIVQAEELQASEDAQVSAVAVEQFMSISFPPRQCLLKPWLTTTGLVMIDAPAGHGKTWLALTIAYAVATGASLLGWSAERRGRVLYVDGELPGELLQRRLQMLGTPLASHFMVLSRSQ